MKKPETFDLIAKEWDCNPVRLERAKVIARELKSKVSGRSNLTALEFGCGTGLLGFELYRYFSHLTFMDTSMGMLDQVRLKLQSQNMQHGEVLCQDILIDPLVKYYDCTFTLMTLHHIDRHIDVIHNLTQQLNPGGIIAIADLCAEDGSFHPPHVDIPHHGFDPEDLASVLSDQGLVEIDHHIVYHMNRTVSGLEKSFPLFLLTGQKPL